MEQKAIAITGMSCIFPGASDLDTYWKNILEGKCLIGPVPPERDNDRLPGEKPYLKAGGFLPPEIQFPPLAYGVMPSACELNADPEQLVTLQLADRALKDSGIDPMKEDLSNSEIIMGRGGYLGNNLRIGNQRIDVLPQVITVLRQLVPGVSDSKLARIKKQLEDVFGEVNPEKAPMAVPNVTTGRISNRFNMMGPNYTIDAACASALIAAEHAVGALRQDRCDRVITGGIYLASNPSFWWMFDGLDALSISGMIKPFSRVADGMLPGEGIGVLVLERLEDAVKAGRRVYAVIRGVGTASDGRGVALLAPRKEGQLESLRRAYRQTGIDPRTIDLLEGHGTATKVGDQIELEAINEFFGMPEDGIPTRALGSVKSMIGHTMPASGAASMIKMALSLYHKILPPTLCDDEGAPKLKDSSFYLNVATRPWVHPSDSKRRAGINAFGFGGINAHAILEEYEETGMDVDDLVMDWPMELFLLSADTVDGLITAVKKLVEQQAAYRAKNRLFGLLSRDVCKTGNKFQKYRLAVIAEDYDNLVRRLEKAISLLTASGGRESIKANGIYFESEPLKKTGKTVFIFPGNAFPGLGEDYTARLSELCLYIPFCRYGFDILDRSKKLTDKHYRFSNIMFTPTNIEHEKFVQLKRELRILDNSASGVFLANGVGFELMTRIGVDPDIITGTSLGEWSAVVSAGMVSPEQLEELNAQAQSREIEEIKGAIGLSVSPVETLMPYLEAFNRDQGTVSLTMDLSPKVTVFAGAREDVDRFCKFLNDSGVWSKYLNLFPIHSPLCQPIADLIHERLEGLQVFEPKVPVYSAATTEPYPVDAEKVRSLLADNAVLPLRMRGLFEKLHDEGGRIFVQLGGGGKIIGQVDETLEGRPYTIVSLDTANRHPIHQLQEVIGVLYAHHIEVNTDLLFQSRNRYLDRSAEEITDRRATFLVPLKTSTPKFTIKDPDLNLLEETAAPAKPASPVETAPAAVTPAVETPPVRPTLPQSQPVAPPAAGPASQWEEIMAEQINTMTRIYAMQKEDEMGDMLHFMNMMECQAQLIMSQNGGGQPQPQVQPQTQPQPQTQVYAPPVKAQPAVNAVRTIDPAQLPFVGKIIEHVEHQKIVIKRKLDLATDLFLKDHAFIPCPNDIKPPEEKLPALPMAVAIEIIAEAAQSLFPGKTVCGLKDIANKQWISLTESEPEKELTVTAQVADKEAAGEIGVACTITVGGQKPSICLTGTILLDENLSPRTQTPPIKDAPAFSRVFDNMDPKQLYRPGGLYHGPCFQGLDTILKTTDGGVEAVLKVPPSEGFFAGHSVDAMILPSQIIDVASQLICCYDFAMKTKNNWVAPVSIDRIWLYGRPPLPGTQVTARMMIRSNDANLVRFDVELAADGATFVIIAGWRDWRMKWSPRLLSAWQQPSESLIARKVENNLVIDDKSALYGIETRDLAGIDPDWLARFYLNSKEYHHWRNLAEGIRNGQLAQYIVVKDAARGLLQQRNIFVYPSQITMQPSGSGRFGIRMNGGRRPSYTEPLSVLSSTRDNETLAMAVPAPIEDFSDIEDIDLFQ